MGSVGGKADFLNVASFFSFSAGDTEGLVRVTMYNKTTQIFSDEYTLFYDFHFHIKDEHPEYK